MDMIAELKTRTHKVESVLTQWAFLKDRLWLILAWPVLCLFIGAAIWTLSLSQLAYVKEAVKSQAFQDARSLSKSYAEQLLRTVEQLDQITLSTAYYWKKSAGALRLEDQARYGLYPNISDFTLGIIDRHGKVITNLHKYSGVVDLSDRAYFQAHKSGLEKGLLVHKIERGRILKKPIVVFSRALTDRNGRFDGVVYAAVAPEFLASFYNKAGEGKNDALAVLDKDGQFIAFKIGENIRQHGTLAKSLAVFPAPQGEALVSADHFLDGRSRIVAWEALDQYPFVSVVAVDERDAYGRYEKTRREYMGMATVASVLLALIGLMGSVFSGRLAWRKHQAAIITDTYRLATEGANEGFFMARTLYGKSHEVADFIVENCNEQGAQMMGFHEQRLIGMRFSQFYSGKLLERVMVIYREAMEKGFYEDEFCMKTTRGEAWMHRRLVRSDGGIAITLRDITEAKEHERILEELGNTDSLTRLPNRHWLSQYLPKSLEKAQKNQDRVAILYLDLDDFKNVNNTMGHAAGDEVLCQAGRRMQSVLRPGDHAVRLGGDEFTVVLSRVRANEDAVRVAERLLEALAKPFETASGFHYSMRASVGISFYPEDGRNMEALLQHADTAMYAAKNGGKGRFAFYDPAQTEQIVNRINNEDALRLAVEDKQFILHYQPRARTGTGELASMEALVRWLHPQRGIVPPLEFIPLAEETGLIIDIGEFVIDQACAQIAAWQKQRMNMVPLSVNVSPKQFAHCDLKKIVAGCIARHGIPPSLLELEITESCMMQESTKVAEDIAAIKSLGIRISVDDFGTGYSSLSQLHRLDLDLLKVDRAFTRELARGNQGEAFFMTIISMAHILDMQVVAEGVETPEQLAILQALGCNEVQGYFISEPIPAAEATELLKRRFLFRHGDMPRHVA